MNIATDAHRSRLARLTTYVASAKALSTCSWKAYKTEHVVVDEVGADPLSNPAQLIIVGQVSHGVSYLGPVGNFNAQFDNMAKAKLTFELELPAESSFTSDYFRAVAALRRFQKDIAKSTDARNLLVDASNSSAIKFGAPLFRPKIHDDDEECLPDGDIADNTDDPSYYPTSSNWPVPSDATQAFMAMSEKYVFDPLAVFTSAGRRIDPLQFARRLPGALVEVHFDLHHWYFSKEKFDSFNAHPRQIVIIKEAAIPDSKRMKKKPARGIVRKETPLGNKGLGATLVVKTSKEMADTVETPALVKKRKVQEEKSDSSGQGSVDTLASSVPSEVVASLRIGDDDGVLVDHEDEKEFAKALTDELTKAAGEDVAKKSSRGKGKARA